MEIKNFVVIGGDRRSLELANLLEVDGHNVRNMVQKVDENIEFKENEIIIGPLPLSRDGQSLEAPLNSASILVEKIFRDIKKDQYLIAGSIRNKHLERASELKIKLIDFFKREEMQILNAIPTIEGAIQVAMENLSVTLHGSNVMVLGYGRIGKSLAKLLNDIGANTYVTARKYEDFAWIENLNYNSVQYKDLDVLLPKMDLVFNTIPSMILREEKLRKLREESLVIDLASNPGGVDFQAAKDIGINAIHALGLPGKYAPVSAANIIKETIYNIIKERGI